MIENLVIIFSRLYHNIQIF